LAGIITLPNGRNPNGTGHIVCPVEHCGTLCRMGVTRVEPVTIPIESISHDRYGIMLHDGNYPTVTASDWLDFWQDMTRVITIETIEIRRIQSNIEKIREVDSIIRSMESKPDSRNDDDFAYKSDDIESDMDFEYVSEHDDRDSSGFYAHKEQQLEDIKKYVESFFDACSVEQEDSDGNTYFTILDANLKARYEKGQEALDMIAQRCETEYTYKQEYESMSYDLRKNMPTR
jgi:hypothetical protein